MLICPNCGRRPFLNGRVEDNHGGSTTVDGRTVDQIAWGDGQPSAVPLGVGGIVPAALEPGTTVGRAPGATQRGQPYDWVFYAGADASPGRQNPMPTVGVLLPLSGADDRPHLSVALRVAGTATGLREQLRSPVGVQFWICET